VIFLKKASRFKVKHSFGSLLAFGVSLLFIILQTEGFLISGLSSLNFGQSTLRSGFFASPGSIL
jgi:hypothetical protein